MDETNQARIRRFAEFPEGWHDGEGDPPSSLSVETALVLTELGEGVGLKVFTFPKVEGGFILEIEAKSAGMTGGTPELHVDIFNDARPDGDEPHGRIVLCLLDGETFEILLENPDATFEQAADEIKRLARFQADYVPA